MHKIKQFTVFMVALIGILFLSSSCGSRKNMVYFQSDSTQISTVYEQFIPKIQANDILTITVSATDPSVTAPFNLGNNIPVTVNMNTDLAIRPTYTVDNDGAIDFPVVGLIKVGGLTRTDAIKVIKSKLSNFIVDPKVNINFANFRVSVLGEVTRPGSFIIPSERVTVLDALGLAGDMTIRGVRNNVLVIREADGIKTLNRLDLTKQDAINSPYYYLAQNDVVYIEPNKAQINNAKLGANTNIIISIAGLLITVISVLTR